MRILKDAPDDRKHSTCDSPRHPAERLRKACYSFDTEIPRSSFIKSYFLQFEENFLTASVVKPNVVLCGWGLYTVRNRSYNVLLNCGVIVCAEFCNTSGRLGKYLMHLKLKL